MNIYLPAPSFQVHANESWRKCQESPALCRRLGLPEVPVPVPHPKLNSEFPPEEWWLEDNFPIEEVTFQGRSVKLQVGIVCVCVFFVRAERW